MELNDISKLMKTEIDLIALIFSLVIGFILGHALRWHYIKFGSGINNRSDFSKLFINLILTITLIIALIKTSLALSLGLVGALSIVRFRTPIKDPEELVYLFFAIAIGLGLGADQILVTLIASFIIMVLSSLTKYSQKTDQGQSLYCTITFQNEAKQKEIINNILALFEKNAHEIDIQHIESINNRYMLTVLCNLPGVNQVTTFIDDIKKIDPSLNISIIDKDRTPAL